MADISFDDLIPAAPGPQNAAPTPGAAPLSFDDLVPPPSDGIGTYAAESGKAFIEGGKNLGASALKGYGAGATGFNKKIVSVLDRIDAGEGVETLPDIEDTMGYRHMSPEQRAQTRAQMAPAAAKPLTENPLYKAGAAVEDFGKDALAPAPGWENSWTRDISSGFGSMIAGMGLSLVPGIGAEMAGAVFLGSGMGEAVDRAKKAGASDEEAIKAAKFGAIAGATDVVDALIPMLGSTGKALGFIRRVGMRAVYGALAEGGQEGLQQFIQNAIAKGIYKPDQDLMEDVPRNMAVGAIVGGATSGGISAAQGRGQQEARLRSGNTATDALPEAPANPESDKALSELDAILADNAPAPQPEPSAPAASAEPDLFTAPPPAPIAEPAGPIEQMLSNAPAVEPPAAIAEPEPTTEPAIVSAPSNEDEKINTAAKSGGIPNGDIVYVPPGLLKVDAKRFQFKGGADEHGVTGALKGVAKWDDRLANPILAWESNDGEVYVANGHQRTDLAKRAEAGGQEDVKIPARILREADGFTPDFMRALGAYQNIAEGTGTAVDAAKVLRANQKDLGLPELPPRSQLVQDAKALAALGNDAFGMVANGLVLEAYAAQVGRILKDPAEQLAAMDALSKSAPANVDQARIMVEDIRESGFLRGAQTGLFGEEEFARSLVAERARILDTAIKNLRKLGSTFKTAVEQEGTLAEAGNKLEREANVKARTENERLAETLRTDGTRKGPISDALSDAARELAAGKRIGTVVPLFLGKVRSLAGGKPQGVQHGAAADRAGPAREEGQGSLYSVGKGRDEQRDLRTDAVADGIKRIEKFEARASGKKPSTEIVELAKGEKREQYVIPGAEKASQGTQAQRKSDQPLKPKVAQKPADIGLFGDDKDQGSLFSLGSPFYSAVGRAVENAKQAKASAAQWLGTIRNAQGVKAEEMEWLGVEEWLNEQKGVVPKDALLDYLRANSIAVNEVEKGATAAPTQDEILREAKEGAEAAGDDWSTLGPNGRQRYENVARQQLEQRGGATKFASYTLPGGENYRELLLTLPTKDTITEKSVKVPNGWGDTDGGNVGVERSGDTGADYRGSHWDEPNVLAHIRFNDRTIDGKKTLFIEEVQSDWHQAGKRRGYKDQGRSVEEIDRDVDAVRDELKRRVPDLDETSSSSWQDAWDAHPDLDQRQIELFRERGQQQEGGSVPDAPFKTTWPELSMKRMIRYAAENGYDAVAWTPGEVQADRYDLSKQVKEITFHTDKPNEGTLLAYGHGGETVINRQVDDAEKELPDIIGKDLAKKLLELPRADQRGTSRKKQSLSGLDLKVGGEGMLGFYDDILPSTVNKLVKKYGARVGQTEADSTHTGLEADKFGPGEWHVVNPDGAVLSEFETRREAEAFIAEKSGGETTRAHIMEITPALRDAALSQGFPLFDARRDLTTEAQDKRPQLERQLTAIIRRIAGDNVKVAFLDTIQLPRSAAKGWGSSAAGRQTAAGSYIPAERLIRVALADPLYQHRTNTAVHESFHAVEHLLLNDREMAVLKKAEPQLRNIAQGFAELSAKQATELADYEVRAIAFEAYAYARGESQPVTNFPAAVRAIFDRLRILFDRLRNALRGMGFKASGDVFSDVYEGRLAGREAKERPIGEAANIKGGAITDTPAFNRWFGASKVVDADGKPKVVYHGTTAAFDTFDPARLGESTRHPTSKLGFFFSASPDGASLFTQAVDETTWPPKLTQRSGASVVPAYLSIKKPFPLSVEQFREINAQPYGEDFEREQPEAAARTQDWIVKNKASLIAKGYDGIHIGGDPKYADRLGGEEYAADAWVAFEPTQIKSATGNSGAFDPANPSALFDIKGPRIDPVALSRFIRGEITASELAADQPKWAKVEAYLAKNFTEAQRARMGSAMDQVMTGDAEALDSLAPSERAVVEKLLGEAGGKPPSPPQAPPATAGGGKGARQRILDRIVPSDKNKPRLPTLNDVYTLAKDDLNPLRVLRNELTEGKDIPIERDPYRLARLTRGAFGKAEQMIETGTFKFGDLSDNGKGLKPILEPVKNDLDGFRAYMAARRALELSGRGIKTGIDPKDAATVVRDGADKYAKPFTELVAYQRRVLDYLRDAGLVSPDAYAAMAEANKDYVPFFRLMEGELSNNGGAGGRSLRVKDPIKGIKGSNREIIDPIESIIKNTYLYIALAEKNRALTALDDLAASSPKGEQFVAKPKEAAAPAAQDPSNPESLSIFKPEAFRPAKDNIAFYRNGKREVRQVQPDVAEAVNAMDRESFGLLLRVLATPARLLRAGATLAPEFIARNPIRDQFSALVFSEHGYVPVYDFVRGLGGIFKNDATYQAWLKAGGANSSMVSLDRHYIEQNVMQLAQDPTFGGRVKNVITKPVELLRMLSELAENATRVGEFKRATAKGKSPMEAAFSAREVTLDFARIGSQMRGVNAIIPFFNASIEGTDREIRGFAKHPLKSSFMVGIGITLPSVLLWFAHHDDDRYPEIPQWQKDLFWLIFTDKWQAISEDDAKQIPAAYKRLRNNQWEQNNGTIWRIPKPFALGLLFGSVPERALDAFYDRHPNAFNHLGKSLQGALLPNMVPAFMAPTIEQYANRSLFTERPIVPKYLEDVLPKYQYAPYTSETAKLLGKAIAKIGGDQTTFASPLVIDNYIRAWTGGLGQYAVSLSDKALTATGIVPSKVNPTLTPADMPVVRAFAVRHPSAGAQSIQDFYETYDERKKALGTVKYLTKLGEPEAAGAEAENHNLETAERIHKALGQQMKFARDVWFNRTMTPDDKRKLIDTTYLQAIDLARVGNDIFRATAQSKKDMKDRAGRLETAP